MPAEKPIDIDAYIAGFPGEIQDRLQQIRSAIQEAVPAATEAIKYGMPMFVHHGNMIGFAAYKTHIGVYPVAAGDEAYEQAIHAYKAAKATLQFPHGQPLPLALIQQTAKLRAAQLESKAAKKKR